MLAARDAAARPGPVWSPLEYACHVRDVHRVFGERVRLMLAEDDPLFANWDQDETALAERYGEQDPAAVADELVEAAEAARRGLRRGRRRRSGNDRAAQQRLGLHRRHARALPRARREHHLHDVS